MKVCVMKVVGIFFLSLKMQLCKTTSLFENTVVDHLHGLVGNKKYQPHKICKDLFIADGSADVTDTVLPAVYV